MAIDVRNDSPLQSNPESSQNVRPYHGKIYETFDIPTRPENANALPGADTNTAGGQPREVGIIEALKTVRLEELTEVHKKPCVRDALLTGIGAGFGVGGIRGILGASLMSSCNWAAGVFCFGSFAMHEYCQRKRQLEMQGMKRAAEIVDRKKIEKEKQAEAVRAERRIRKEEADRIAERKEKRRNKSWWEPRDA